MKKIYFILSLMLALLPATVWGQIPITTISNEADLKEFSEWVNGENGKTAHDYKGETVTLKSDFALTSVWTPIGTSGKEFKGTFEGENHVISNVTVTSTTGNNGAGLFGNIQSATIQNLGVEIGAGGITGNQMTGGIAGAADGFGGSSMSISNCYVIDAGGDGITGTGYAAGGIVGYISQNVTITNCYAKCDVTAGNLAGGIGGFFAANGQTVTISNCYAIGAISAPIAGGIIPENTSPGTGIVSNCIALNTEDISSGTYYRIGNTNSLSGNYASPKVTINGSPVEGGATDNENGADLTKANFVNSNDVFAGWDNTIWDFTDMTKLPTLMTVGGTQIDISRDSYLNPPKTYAITITQPSEGGTFKVMNGNTPVNTNDRVEEDTELTLSATANDGYELEYFTADGVNIGTGTSYTVKKAITLSVVFKKKDNPNPPVPPVVIWYKVSAPAVSGITFVRNEQEYDHLEGEVLEGTSFSFFLKTATGITPTVSTSRGDMITPREDGKYIVRDIQQDLTIHVSTTPVGNEEIESTTRVWSEASTIVIHTDTPATVAIVNAAGKQEVQKEIPAGETRFRVAPGFHIVKVADKTFKRIVD